MSQNSFPSLLDRVKSLTVKIQNERSISSGFCLSGNLILTCWHSICDTVDSLIYIHRRIDGILSLDTDSPLEGKVVWKDVDLDVALIELNRKDVKLPSLQLASFANIELGDKFISYGFNKYGIYGDSVVSTIEGVSIENKNIQRFKLRGSDFLNGFSGSALYSVKSNKILGINQLSRGTGLGGYALSLEYLLNQTSSFQIFAEKYVKKTDDFKLPDSVEFENSGSVQASDSLENRLRSFSENYISQLFSTLEKFLTRHDFFNADITTSSILLASLFDNERGWINSDIIGEIDDEIISRIDNIWLNYSNRRFGIRPKLLVFEDSKKVSKILKIRVSETMKKLGWVDENTDGLVYDYKNLTFNLEAPYGHLPTLRFMKHDHSLGIGWGANWEKNFRAIIKKLSN